MLETYDSIVHCNLKLIYAIYNTIQYNTIQYNTFYLLQCKQCTFCKITIIKQQSSRRDFELLETIK